jgi:anthranilate synthase component 1
MDTCLAIRTMVGRGRTVSVQAGGGVVADSDPAAEYQETVNKASAMLRAIEMAENNT